MVFLVLTSLVARSQAKDSCSDSTGKGDTRDPVVGHWGRQAWYVDMTARSARHQLQSHIEQHNILHL